MQPIIRRTITITLTETWIITWADGQETVWTETHEVVAPPEHEPGEGLHRSPPMKRVMTGGSLPIQPP